MTTAMDDELHSRLIDAGKSGDLSQRAFVEQHLTHPTGFVRACSVACRDLVLEAGRTRGRRLCARSATTEIPM